jgi:regulator of nucleoside diphosphate kinase
VILKENKMTVEDRSSATIAPAPAIILSPEDYGRLTALADVAQRTNPELAANLADEIGRAHVLANGQRPEEIVCMNSEVEFHDDTANMVRKVTLVYPEEANISQGKVSVMTPVGTALIGLPKGSSITWKTLAGDVRRLTVLSVRGV